MIKHLLTELRYLRLEDGNVTTHEAIRSAMGVDLSARS
jgi:hypothetical protein